MSDAALRRLLLFCALFFCGLAPLADLPARAATNNPNVMKWKVDGVEREAIVFAPTKTDGSGKAPVILAFHGHGDIMQNAQRGMRFETYWPEAVVVYPQGLPTNPAEDPEGYGWIYKPGDADGLRDVKFVDAMLATMHQKFPVDDQRVYATGFSNGAMFSYVLWGARTNVFAAFAIVSGRIPDNVHLSVAKPLLAVAGQQDRTVIFKDQLKSIAAARELDGAEGEGKACGGECMNYASSKGTPVVTFIHGGGHVYPPGTPYITVLFFKEHTLGK